MNQVKIGNVMLWSGAVLVVFALLLLALIFYPALKEEARYRFTARDNTDISNVVITKDSTNDQGGNIVPADAGFSIIVPKIGGNAPVIENIDPYNEHEYRNALENGVAHANGSVVPGEKGNTFLFAHSSDNFYTANHYNTVFYLLHKLENGDQFFIVHDNRVYKYIVSGTQEVAPEAVEYLETKSNDTQTATLMTCWPPGTTSSRLLVFGELEDSYDL